MTLFGQYAVQQALYAVLTEDAELMGCVQGVFDYVPVDTAFPYVTLGDARVEDYSTAALAGFRQIQSLHVYSRARGRKEVMEIMARLHALLHDAAPEAEGCSIISTRFRNSRVAVEKDGLTLHGVFEVEVLAQQ